MNQAGRTFRAILLTAIAGAAVWSLIIYLTELYLAFREKFEQIGNLL